MLDDLERATVIGMAEGGNHHGVVADVEVGVARRKAPVAIADAARHRQWNDIRDETPKPVVILLQDFVIFV